MLREVLREKTGGDGAASMDRVFSLTVPALAEIVGGDPPLHSTGWTLRQYARMLTRRNRIVEAHRAAGMWGAS